jgi:uncharacterized protein YjbI with pentapeptide repeats
MDYLEKHKKWLFGDKEGERAVLSEAVLSDANLRRADLRRANLSDANLRRANLSEADLRWADLSGANLREADLREADLRGADLRGADLSGADLSDANLRRADLRGADLSGANLRWADLSEAVLSGCKGLLSPIDYLKKNFEKTKKGYICYKTFNSNYETPNYWEIKKNSIITEVVNADRTVDCACGVNVGTLEWVQKNNNNNGYKIWKCLIEWEWLAGVVVPYHTDGKIRCEKIRLLEVI